MAAGAAPRRSPPSGSPAACSRARAQSSAARARTPDTIPPARSPRCPPPAPLLFLTKQRSSCQDDVVGWVERSETQHFGASALGLAKSSTQPTTSTTSLLTPIVPIPAHHRRQARIERDTRPVAER